MRKSSPNRKTARKLGAVLRKATSPARRSGPAYVKAVNRRQGLKGAHSESQLREHAARTKGGRVLRRQYNFCNNLIRFSENWAIISDEVSSGKEKNMSELQKLRGGADSQKLKTELKKVMKPALKKNMKPALKKDMKPALKKSMKPALKKSMKDTLKQGLKPSLKTAMKKQMKPSLKSSLKGTDTGGGGGGSKRSLK
jgi:hypothetical protein